MSACWKTWKLCFVTVFPNQMLGFVEEMGRNFLRAQFARLQASMSTKTCGRFYYGMCGSYRMLEWCASYWDDADSATSVWENLVYYQGHICNTFLVANVILKLCINAVWVMLKCPRDAEEHSARSDSCCQQVDWGLCAICLQNIFLFEHFSYEN